jgi:hypothetical protein
MQEERTQDQRIAALHRAGHHRSAPAEPVRESRIDQSLLVSSRNHLQRTVFLRAAIEVNADGD